MNTKAIRNLSGEELVGLWYKSRSFPEARQALEAELVFREKGGPGSGWFAPPKGTHGPGSLGGGAPAGAVVGQPGDTSRSENERMGKYFSETVPGGGWRDATGPERGAVKHALVTELSEQAGVPYDLANSTIRQWSHSSNDEDMRSLSLQEAVSEEFGVPLSDFQKNNIQALEDDRRHRGSISPKLVGLDDRPTERRMMRAMYDNTQSHLAEQGFKSGDTIRLYRGVTFPSEISGNWRAGDTIGAVGNAAESWSIGIDVAKMVTGWSYGDQRVVMAMDVPVEMVLGTCKTGWGCLTEGEVIVFGSVSGSRVRIMEID